MMRSFLWMTVMYGLAYAWFPKFDPAKPDLPLLVFPDQYTIQRALDPKSICLVQCIAGVGRSPLSITPDDDGGTSI